MYIKCREIILCTFDIIAIAEFGSGTFGQTGTNTVTLFLRKKKTHPVRDDHYKNRIQSWFHNDTRKDIVFEDYHLFEAYCTHIGVKTEDYKALFTYTADWKKVLGSYEIFKEYITEFSNDAKAKAIQKKKISGKYTNEMQSDELEKHIYYSVCQIEQEKLLFFCLAMTNGQEVAVIRSPAATKEMKAFLGYEWSGAKGNEGIKYLGITNEREDDELTHNKGIQHIKTPLFNPADFEDTAKLNTLIRTAFEKKPVIIPDNLKEFASLIPLHFMLDFNRVKFDKALKLTADKKIEIKSRYPLVKLGEIAEIIAGQSPESKYYNDRKSGIPFYQGKKEFGFKFLNNPVIWTTSVTKESVQGDILMSVRAPVGNVNINPFKSICIGRGLSAIRCNNEKTGLYLFHYLDLISETIAGHLGATFSSISREEIANISIPLPSLDVQQQIVAGCEKVDEEYSAAQYAIEENKRNIEKLMSEVKGERKKLGSVISLEYGKALPENKRITGQYPVMGSNGIIGYHNEFLVEGPSIIVGRKGSAGAVNWVEENNFPIDTTYYVHLLTDTMDLKFVYYIIANIGLETMNSSIGAPGLNRNDAYAITIPVPPLEEQQRIVQEIETYEAEIVSAKSVLSACAEKKKMILEKWL